MSDVMTSKYGVVGGFARSIWRKLVKKWKRWTWRKKVVEKHTDVGMTLAERKTMLKGMSKGELVKMLIMQELWASVAVNHYGVPYEPLIQKIVSDNKAFFK